MSLNVSESNAVFTVLHACNLLPKVPGRSAPTHIAVEEAVLLLADAAAKRLMVSVDRADIAERLAGEFGGA
jgi:hypothetical protein